VEKTGEESILPAAPLRCICAAVTGLQAGCFGTKLCMGCRACLRERTAPASRVDILGMQQGSQKTICQTQSPVEDGF